MEKFVMECPSCKMPLTVSEGLFFKKKVKCECGQTVVVNKISEEPCPECGNIVRYDRTKTYTPKCTSCKHIIDVQGRIFKAMKKRQEAVFGENTIDLSKL